MADTKPRRTREVFSARKRNVKTLFDSSDSWVDWCIRTLIKVVVIVGTAAGGGAIIQELMQ